MTMLRRWWYRWLGRRRPPARAELPVRDEPVHAPVPIAVVDGTDTDVHRVLGMMLLAAGIPAHPSERIPDDGPVLLLMPVGTGGVAPAPAARLMVELEDLRPGGSDTAVVVAWFVEEGARADLAVLYDASGRRPAGNAAAVLVGPAWNHELAAHGGRTAEAVGCRSIRVREVLDAPNAQPVGDARPAMLHASLARFDPGFLDALCVGLATPTRPSDPGPVWAGLDGVVAAVRIRLAGAAAAESRR